MLCGDVRIRKKNVKVVPNRGNWFVFIIILQLHVQHNIVSLADMDSFNEIFHPFTT